MRGWGFFLGLVLVVAVGCNGAKKPLAQKQYRLRGKIVAVDAGGGHVTVDAGAIPGLMDAMTMSYKLLDATVASELHPGDVITSDVIVDEDAAGPLNPRLDHIVVVAQASPNYKPKVDYHVPAPGDAVPDFQLLNQSGKTIHLAQFRGKAVLLTFIYTRCPLADYCPRMSENFSAIDKALAGTPAYKKTHLVSVSFDPKYDTPTVLRSYGGAHTGKFTDEDFSHWDFAAAPVAELSNVEQWFDLGVTGGGDPSSIQHSLSTVLIGRDGKVVAWYPTNDWKVADVLAAVEKAAA